MLLKTCRFTTRTRENAICRKLNKFPNHPKECLLQPLIRLCKESVRFNLFDLVCLLFLCFGESLFARALSVAMNLSFALPKSNYRRLNVRMPQSLGVVVGSAAWVSMGRERMCGVFHHTTHPPRCSCPVGLLSPIQTVD